MSNQSIQQKLLVEVVVHSDDIWSAVEVARQELGRSNDIEVVEVWAAGVMTDPNALTVSSID